MSKMTSLTPGLKFLRRRLGQDKFIKATTSQYYGLVYYGSQVWLGQHTPVSQLRRLNSLHYKLLRIAVQDWKRKSSRSDLDEIGRVRPSQWYKYATGSLIIKIMNRW